MESSTTTSSDLQDLANLLRIDSINMTECSKSGHPTTCSSMAELMSVLFFHKSGMKYNAIHPKDLRSDRLILSKGHAAPILYAVWAYIGYLEHADLLNLRKITSILEGHPTPKLPFVDVATGSLGQGLGAACGMAYCCKYIDKKSNRFFTILGDGEMAEGSVWEACNFAGFYKLDNLIAFVDVNRLGQSGEAMFQHNMDSYLKKFEGFGWDALVIDGHNVEQIVLALEKSQNVKDKPFAIILQTFKGKNFTSEIENNLNWHGKVLGPKYAEIVINHLKSLIKNPKPALVRNLLENSDKPEEYLPQTSFHIVPQQKLDTLVATRSCYGIALNKLAAQSNHREIVVLDADTRVSTFSHDFGKAHPDLFVECYIAEQNMISVAAGLWARGKIPFVSTFGAFLERAYDQIRMAAITGVNLKLNGSHVGVSIGEDGPSQMALEDISCFKPFPNMHILYPSDGVSAEKAVEVAANTKGLVYIRSSRPVAKFLYKNEEEFQLGKLKVIEKSEKDIVCVIGGGVTVHEALKAHCILAKENINIRVIDIFSIKPIDVEGLKINGKEAGGKILVVEDHYADGGIKDSVASALSTTQGIITEGLAVNGIPFSGTPEELVKHFGIDCDAIVQKVKNMIK